MNSPLTAPADPDLRTGARLSLAPEREHLAHRVELRINDFFESRGAGDYGEHFADLWARTGENALGGKLVRPLLLLETYEALRPAAGFSALAADREAALEVALAVELLHCAFLLHDDVIDSDTRRRGRPNLIGELAARFEGAVQPGSPIGPADTAVRHWAGSAAILSGDLLLAGAHLVVARAPMGNRTRLRLLDAFEQAVIETASGEYLDVGLSDGVVPPDLSVVLTMTAQKTAAYSFELPLRAAAILAGRPSQVEDDLRLIGHHLGVAFQLRDDLLSVFDAAEAGGKDLYSDLREGKQTALIAYARTTAAWPRIADRFGARDLRPEEAAGMRSALEECGARSFVEGLLAERIEAVTALLDGPPNAGGSPRSWPPALRALIFRMLSWLGESVS